MKGEKAMSDELEDWNKHEEEGSDKKPDSDPERVSTDEPMTQSTEVVVVLSEDPNTGPGVRRRRVRRREDQPFTEAERIQIDEEIIAANAGLIDTEKEKAAQTKLFNGHIAEYRQTLDDAIEVLRKGVFQIDVERIEEFNYESGEVIYYDVESDKEVDRRDMTEEELQTKMKM